MCVRIVERHVDTNTGGDFRSTTFSAVGPGVFACNY